MAGVLINDLTIRKAKAKAVPGAAQEEILDSRVEGLRLRIGARGVRWQIRMRFEGASLRLDLGDVDEWRPGEARDIAIDAKRLAKSGSKPDDAWLEGVRIARGKKEAAPAPPPPKEPDGWTWEAAKGDYLAAVERTRRPSTHTDYTNMLGTPELGRFAGRPVHTISLEEMSEVIADVHKRGVERHAEHLASVVRPMWKHLAAPENRLRTLVTPYIMRDLSAPERTRAVEEEETEQTLYVPPMIEVGRIVAICRSGALHPLIAGAIELMVFTAQRVSPIAMARRDKFEKDHGYETLWGMPPVHRKTADRMGKKADHVLPLTDATWSAVEKAVDWCLAQDDDRLKESRRVFPQIKARRKGDDLGPLAHIAQSTIGHGLGYMPGVQATPHDLRRAFGTHGEVDLGFKRPETKLILDHNEGRESGDVTAASYALHHRLAEKWEIMTAWASHVEKHVVEATQVDPRLSDINWLSRQIKYRQDAAKNVKSPRSVGDKFEKVGRLPQTIE